MADSSIDRPRRAHVLQLEIGANTTEDMIGALRCFITSLERGELSGSGVSGGPSFGWSYDLSIDESWTNDRYFAAIDDWLTTLDAATPTTPDTERQA